MAAKVLIVEDDPMLALDLRHEVEGLGFEVMGMAESADEAILASMGNIPDLALMDIQIDGSMDGIQTAQILQKDHRVPVVFLTSCCDDATISRAAQAMPYGYLVKPYKLQDLKASIHTALNKAMIDAARESDQMAVSNAIKSLSEAVVALSLDRKIQYMNDTAEKMAGCRLEEAKGKSFSDVLDIVDSRKHSLQSLNDATNTTQVDEFACSLTKKDRTQVMVDYSSTATTDQSGRRTGYVVTLKEAAQRLRSQVMEDSLDEVHSFDIAPSPMVQLDGDGFIVRVNEAMLQEAKMDASVMVGRSLTGLMMDPDPRIARDLFHKLLQADTSFTTNRPRIVH
jgi:PAS domain S-box-containing protein